MDPDEVIRIVAVDDHPAVLAGVTVWCAAADPPIELVAAGADPAVAWAEPGRNASVVVLDLQLGGALPAFAELQRFVDAGRQVVVYSMREDSRTALICLEVGAFTYLTKAEGHIHLVAAIHAAAARRPYVSPSLAGALGTDTRKSRPTLTPRERDVMLLWFHCESKDMVAKKLGLSARTVAGYIDRVRIKYANAGRVAPTKAALVARAIQDGLISLEDL
ncbi:DNA-binding response regulator [Frankia sp. Cr1]|uniref:DNA-binding response regulator n=1 Tax=Frankia sp. Cr1 TaxID=3073931 RepID=UPI002AD3DCBF|nr:response regulator [Frankia sp. Cr1]